MDEVWRTAGWFAVAGAAGGALNAWLSDNRRLWPTRVTLGTRSSIVQPGLGLSVIVGVVASVAALRAFTGFTCQDGMASWPSVGTPLAAAIVVSVLAARWLSSDADKRLLRAAAGRAAAAPAAHPDAVAALETATPHEMFEAATRLLPQHRR